MLMRPKLTYVRQVHGLVSRLCTQAAVSQQTSKPVQEIVIPVPWGHIAGKWWGPADVKPILCLHGWQDNAGTWDTLAPLLPPDVSLLAIDFPGHGLSSHYPPGHPYYQMDIMAVVRRIVKHYGWDGVSLMGHSLGSIVSFLYACTFPGEVTNYVGIDALEPHVIAPAVLVETRGRTLDKIIETVSLDSRNRPTYTYEDAILVCEKGSNNSLTRDSCEILMKRGTIKHKNGKYSFNTDVRLKHGIVPGWPLKNILIFASSITCSVLNIKADAGFRYNAEENYQQTAEALQKSVKHCEFHVVGGTHHVHLNNPERIAPLITKFLQGCVVETV